ncbi:hypothetical protein LSAT2_017847, partial [Lamellibrachia satsuma]
RKRGGRGRKKDRWDEISSHIGINCRDYEETYTASEKCFEKIRLQGSDSRPGCQGSRPDRLRSVNIPNLVAPKAGDVSVYSVISYARSDAVATDSETTDSVVKSVPRGPAGQ